METKYVKDSTKSLVTLLLAVPTMLLNGVVLCNLWAWFITSTFGLPVLSIPQALGIDVLITYVVATSYKPIKKETLEEFVSRCFYPIGFALTTWLIGWIITWFL